MEASCSVRVVQPFVALAATNEVIGDLVPREIRAMDPDARLPLRLSQHAMSLGSERLRDPHLGLKLGQMLCFGMAGTFDYAVRSAPTVRDSIGIAMRYSRLIADPFHVSFETRDRRAMVRLDDEIPWSKTAGDFALSGWFRTHTADELPSASQPECWFPYSAPADTTDYERTFPGATFRFKAPFLGVVFDRSYEDAPMPVGDPALHAVLCSRADALLLELNPSRSVTLAVRRLIAEGMRDRKEVTLQDVARSTGMSQRTVTRKLEREGTNFAKEFDDNRRRLALASVLQSDVPLVEIAFQLGFSHVESFHRAFRRWTGNTPHSYRRSFGRAVDATVRD